MFRKKEHSPKYLLGYLCGQIYGTYNKEDLSTQEKLDWIYKLSEDIAAIRGYKK